MLFDLQCVSSEIDSNGKLEKGGTLDGRNTDTCYLVCNVHVSAVR